MGVAVLNPQDCLQNPLSYRQSLIYPPPTRRVKQHPENAHSNFDKANPAQSNRRRRSPNKPKLPAHNTSPPPRSNAAKLPAKNLVLGQVKILKRGEQVFIKSSPEKAPQPSKIEDVKSQPLASIGWMDPNPVAVPTQIRLFGSKNRINGFYAGSAFVTSPSPSSLPLPAFVTKKTVTLEKKDGATSDLHRILGLNL